MKKYNLKRFLASLLAVLMLASVTGVSPAVFADSYEAPVLQNGEAVIANADVTKQVLAKTLISNYDKCNPDTRDNLDWQYYCKSEYHKYDKGYKDDWVSINGQNNKKYGSGLSTRYYDFKSLFDNSYATYQVRIGSGTAVSFTKLEPQTLTYDDHAVTVAMPYTGATSVDYAKLEQLVLDEVNKGTNYKLTRSNTKITYYATANTGSLGSLGKDWVPLAGKTNYPAVSEGTQQVKLSFKGEGAYSAKDIPLNVTFLGREASVINFKANPTVKIQYNDDLSIKLPELKAAIWENVVDSTTPADLSTANVSIKYYAKAESGSLGELGHAWADLNGEKINGLTYPAISEGKRTLRFEFAGNANYKGFSEDVEVTFTGRDPAFELIKGVTEIDAKFADAKNLDTEAIANEIRNVLVEKLATDESIKLSDVKVEYKTSRIGSYKVLDKNASLDADDIGDTIHLRLSWGDGKGTAQYKPFEATVDIKLVDNRTPSVVALVDVANITYNMDAKVMIEEIIKNAIDSANSTLPADYKASDFTVRYDDDGTWAPIEGEYKTILGQTVTIHSHLNAGDGQKIQVTFNGSKDYKPSDTAEGTLNVAKADVKVNIKRPFITMHAGDADLPEGSITLNPNDPEIDVYTIFAGVTSKIGGKVTTSVYLDLPDRFTNNKALTLVLDPLVEKIIGRSFTEILQEGITVGELRELAKAATSAVETLKPILKAVGIDVDSFLKVMELINNLPNIADDMVIAIGTPNHAGIYQAFAVTNSINYNTAFGTGTVLVLKNFTGVEIVKSNKLDDGKLTAKEAQDILDGNDQLCTLQKDGKNLNNAAQKALHYRFTGINGGKLYSSHDMPVDPGKYIVTVSVRGGDFYAFPKTFTFTIVADPTPEVNPET